MHCYLCRSSSFVKISDRVRDRDDIKVLKCDKCGLVFLEKSDHICKKFYQNGEMEKSISSANIINFDMAETTDFVDTNKRFNLHHKYFINKRVLDFGCGRGSFLKKIKHEGIANKLYALEPNSSLQEFLKKDFPIFSSISEIPDASLDIISMFHVLEHIPDPLKVLDELYNKLAVGGKIIIEVPHSEDALLKLYECEAFANFTYWSCHLYLFNLSNLESLIKKTKYKINCIKQYQRYSLANHLHWLAKNKPAGHIKWAFLEDEFLHEIYEKKLAEIGQCDTLVAIIEK